MQYIKKACIRHAKTTGSRTMLNTYYCHEYHTWYQRINNSISGSEKKPPTSAATSGRKQTQILHYFSSKFWSASKAESGTEEHGVKDHTGWETDQVEHKSLEHQGFTCLLCGIRKNETAGVVNNKDKPSPGHSLHVLQHLILGWLHNAKEQNKGFHALAIKVKYWQIVPTQHFGTASKTVQTQTNQASIYGSSQERPWW